MVRVPTEINFVGSSLTVVVMCLVEEDADIYADTGEDTLLLGKVLLVAYLKGAQ